MGQDIKRATELYICEKLSTAIPDHKFVSFLGGTASTDAEELEPPFTIVGIGEAKLMFSFDSTWEITGTVQVITNADETASPDHSDLVSKIREAIGDIPAGSSEGFAFHGISITAMRNTQDDALACHADIFDFNAGVGG